MSDQYDPYADAREVAYRAGQFDLIAQDIVDEQTLDVRMQQGIVDASHGPGDLLFGDAIPDTTPEDA